MNAIAVSGKPVSIHCSANDVATRPHVYIDLHARRGRGRRNILDNRRCCTIRTLVLIGDIEAVQYSDHVFATHFLSLSLLSDMRSCIESRSECSQHAEYGFDTHSAQLDMVACLHQGNIILFQMLFRYIF